MKKVQYFISVLLLVCLSSVLLLGCSKDERERAEKSSTPSTHVEKKVIEPKVATKPEKEIMPQESKPVAVNWQSPVIAGKYLAGDGLPMVYKYSHEGNGAYWGQSDDQSIGSSYPYPSHNICYSITGSRNKVNKLALRLQMFTAYNPNAEEAHAVLLRYSKILYQKIHSKTLPTEVQTAITSGEPGQWNLQGATIELNHEPYPSGKGYSLTFIVRDLIGD